MTSTPRILAVVFGVALLLRVAYVLEHDAVLGLDYTLLPQTDNYVFAQWAASIADGDVLCREQPHAYHLWTQEVAPEDRWLEWYGGAEVYHQSPLYAYVVAAVYALWDRAHVTIGLVQALLGALTCALTALLAIRLHSPRLGWIAGLLLAFTGSFFFYDAFVLRDGMMALLVVILALGLERATNRGLPRDWLLAGATLGLFTLGKETGPTLLLLTAAGVLWWRRHEPALAARSLALLVLGALLLLAPAIARNVAVGAPPLALSTRGPEVFVAGNAAGQDGVGWDPPVETMREILMDSNFSLSGAIARTLATHRADPWGYLGLLWNKTSAYFNSYEVPNNVNFYLSRAHLWSLRAGFVSLWFLSPAALLGLLLALPRRRTFASTSLLAIALSASVIALYILGRFRLQALPLFAVFAAVTTDWAIGAWRERRTVALALTAVPFALLLAWTYHDENRIGDHNKHAGVMMQLVKAGNFDQAIRYRDELLGAIEEAPADRFDASLEWKLEAIWDAFAAFDRSIAAAPGSAEQHLARADGYAALLPITKRGDRVEFTELALRHYERALEAEPDVVGAHHGVGAVYGQIDRPGDALAAFKRELAVHPEHGPSLRDAGMLHFAWQQPADALRYFLEAEAAGLADAPMIATAARISIDPMLRDVGPVRVRGEPTSVYEPDRALGQARRALQLAPDDYAVREAVADVLYAHDVFDEAIELLEGLAAETDPRIAWKGDQFRAKAEAFAKRRDTVLEARALEQDAAAPDAPGSVTEESEDT